MDVRRFAHQHRTAAPRRAEARACRHGVLPASGRCRRSVPARAQQGGGGGGLPFGLGKIFGGGGGGAGANSGAPATEASLTPEARFVMSQGSDDPEFPPFQVVQKTKDYSLRLYSSYPVVEMDYATRAEAYAALGSYVDGPGNAEGVRFAYTQPVTMVYEDSQGAGRKVMQMYLGSRVGASARQTESVASLPAPTEPNVRVSIAGGELIAVRQFEGYITPTNAEAARQALLAALRRDGVKLSEEAQGGAFRVGQFGALFQLAGRINEVYVKVTL